MILRPVGRDAHSSPSARPSHAAIPDAPPAALLAYVAAAIAEADPTGTPRFDDLDRSVTTVLTEYYKIIGSDVDENDAFGTSVSIFGDRVLVGAPNTKGGNETLVGAAYIFKFDGTSWLEEAKLTASDGGQSDLFGITVSLSGDRALIGAPGFILPGGEAAYVFVFDGSSWIEEAKLTAPNPVNDAHFGTSVSLSGNRALIGASYDGIGGVRTGSAHVFEFDGTSWTETAKLIASDPTPRDNFGISVSLVR